MSEALLKDRDYTVIIARMTSTPLLATPGSETRWIKAQDSIIALAKKCEEFDPDGITIYIAGEPVEKYDRATAEHLVEFLQANHPPGNTNLAGVLQTALDDYFQRKTAGKTKPNGEIIVVLLDSEPGDRMAVMKAIIKATKQLDRDDELGIGFAQVGDNIMARGFLNALDDDLQVGGAQFDIVDTKILEQLDESSLTDFLLDILRD